MDEIRRWLEEQSPKTNSWTFGTFGLILGGLLGSVRQSCWHIGPIGECLEQGSRGSFVLSAITDAIVGAVFGRHIFAGKD